MNRLALLCLLLVCIGKPGLGADSLLTSGLKTEIEFARVGEVSLKLDAFTPEGKGPFPACILVHGGGFINGTKQSYIKPLFEPLSQAGFAWFTIDYRLAPAHRWPACAEDVEAAIRWVKAHAVEYRVDVDRIALIGESAGGHLVSYAGARGTDETRVAAVVPFYAPHDLEFQVRNRNALGPSMTALLGLTELNEAAWTRLREVSASTYIHEKMPPYYLIHGDQDEQVPYEQSVRFQRQLRAAGNTCDLLTIPGGIHGMGYWDKLGSDYKEQMIAWLKKTLAVREAGKPDAKEGAAAPPDVQLLPPEEAARTAIVPEGFRVTLFAGEPDVQQPIGFCLDDRGRLWVAEAYSYPNVTVKTGKDRILIFEDADGDGRFDRRTEFYEGLNYVTGVEVGFGGAWVMSPPNFYFIPDRNGDDAPDGPPEVLLDGFGTHANAHNLANGFAWGPDGWLYGTHGRTNWSTIGKPGTPNVERVRFDGGVYRYHPVRHVWEPFADGTTNPWGIDWDDFGEAFVCNCVDPHLFHVIQGAHYEPWRNRESSQFAYERIASIADHLHFVGGDDIRLGIGSSEEDAAGGGHAHCGTMVYLGDNWPDRYRNTVFMNNLHGHRINNDILRRVGSGYSASHGPDLMRSRDPWFMGVSLQYGPDGAVYASDWSDTGECHSVTNTQRQTGRIFKIAYGTPRVANVDVAKLDDGDLVKLQLHRNDWYVRHARRVLQERAASGRDMSEVRRALLAMFAEQADVTRQLRALWTLHAIGSLDDEFLLRQLDHTNEYIRGWSIRLLCEDENPPAAALDRFRDLAATDESPYVRLQLASGLQRLSFEKRWPIAAALVTRAEDANDANLPSMIWYGIEPLVNDDLERFVALADSAEIPLVRRHIARRAVSSERRREALNAVVTVLKEYESPEIATDFLTGALQGLEGLRSAQPPAAWPNAFAALRHSPSEAVHERALQLALIFDDPTALEELRQQASDAAVPAPARNRALQSLVAKKAKGVPLLLFKLMHDPATQGAALRGLAEFNEPLTAQAILDSYTTFDAAARQDALQTLASRATWAATLLDAVEAGRIPHTDLTAYTARQLQSLGDRQLSARVNKLWGEVRKSPADKARQIADFKKRITPGSLARADRSAGRAVFQKNCANCHRLFDAGGAIGPDLTGAQRTNLDYLLENLVDPSAAVAKDFQLAVIETADGRVLTGLVVGETPNAVTVQTVNEKLVVPTAEIDRRTASPLSLMPDGALQQLSLDQVRDLLAYLSGTRQVRLPEDAEAVSAATTGQ